MMSQHLPGRDIDSFCPRAPPSDTPDVEPDVQTNQNASVCSRPSSRNLDDAFEVEPGDKQLEKNVDRSPVLNDVAVLEEYDPASIDSQSSNHSAIFEEEQVIQEIFNPSLLQLSIRMTSPEAPDNSPLLEECAVISSPAGSVHSIENSELREDDDHNSSVVSSHKSSILDGTEETLSMVYEQDQSPQYGADNYVYAEDISVENEPRIQPNAEKSHCLSDKAIASGKAEHNSPFQSPQPSFILNHDEATSPLRYEQESSSQTSYDTQVCAEDAPNERDSRVQSNIDGYHLISEFDEGEASLSGLTCPRRPLSPEVVSRAGPREHVGEYKHRKTRLPRRASLVAREAIGLSMQALFTPTKLISDRVFEKSHSKIDAFSDFTQSTVSSSQQRSPEAAVYLSERSGETLKINGPRRRASQVARDSINLTLMAINTPKKIHSDKVFKNESEWGRRSACYDDWSVDSFSSDGSCKLILRRLNRSLQRNVEFASSCSSPRARSLPIILQSSRTKSNISTPLGSIEETEDENAGTPKTRKQEKSCDNTLTYSLDHDEETPRPRRSESLALRERNRNIPSDGEGEKEEIVIPRRRKSLGLRNKNSNISYMDKSDGIAVNSTKYKTETRELRKSFGTLLSATKSLESFVQETRQRLRISQCVSSDTSPDKENTVESPVQKNETRRQTTTYTSNESSLPDKNVAESLIQTNRNRKRAITYTETESSSDRENKGDAFSKSKGVRRLISFDSSDTAPSVTTEDWNSRNARRRRRRRRRTRLPRQSSFIHSSSTSPILQD